MKGFSDSLSSPTTGEGGNHGCEGDFGKEVCCVDPETDVQLRVVPPPEMVANLRADNIDGFLAPDNICQRAIYDGVGFLHILSKEIWDGHPCCSFAASREFITTSPNSFAALTRAIIDATAYASRPDNRKQLPETIPPANYINPPIPL